MADYALYDRRYELTVSDGVEEKIFEGGQKTAGGKWEGYDIFFKVVKTGDAVPNECEIEIKNLKPEHRAWLSRQNLKLTLKAGYREGFGAIFMGNLELAGHTHQGEEWVTKMYAKDGGAALRDLTIFKTWKKGTSITTVIEAILKKITSLPTGLPAELQKINQMNQGYIDLQSFKPQKPKPKEKKKGAKPAPLTVEQQKQKHLTQKQNARESTKAKELKRAETLAGAAKDKLQLLCDRVGLVLIINDQTIHIFPKGLSLGDEEIVLDQTAGLIGSPEKTADGSRQGGYESMSLLRFEFNPGRPVFVDSLYVSESQVIWRVEHEGSIPGDWRTKIFTEKREDG